GRVQPQEEEAPNAVGRRGCLRELDRRYRLPLRSLVARCRQPRHVATIDFRDLPGAILHLKGLAVALESFLEVVRAPAERLELGEKTRQGTEKGFRHSTIDHLTFEDRASAF